jgi:tryptophanyl-tRNA synthetase
MPHSTRTWLITILLLSVLLRAGVAFYLGDTVPVGKDEQSYSELAARLATGHGYSFAVPWYPFAPVAGRVRGAVRYGIMPTSTTATHRF